MSTQGKRHINTASSAAVCFSSNLDDITRCSYCGEVFEDDQLRYQFVKESSATKMILDPTSQQQFQVQDNRLVLLHAFRCREAYFDQDERAFVDLLMQPSQLTNEADKSELIKRQSVLFEMYKYYAARQLDLMFYTVLYDTYDLIPSACLRIFESSTKSISDLLATPIHGKQAWSVEQLGHFLTRFIIIDLELTYDQYITSIEALFAFQRIVMNPIVFKGVATPKTLQRRIFGHLVDHGHNSMHLRYIILQGCTREHAKHLLHSFKAHEEVSWCDLRQTDQAYTNEFGKDYHDTVKQLNAHKDALVAAVRTLVNQTPGGIGISMEIPKLIPFSEVKEGKHQDSQKQYIEMKFNTQRSREDTFYYLVEYLDNQQSTVKLNVMKGSRDDPGIPCEVYHPRHAHIMQAIQERSKLTDVTASQNKTLELID